MPLDHSGQLHRQLIQIGNIHKGIPVNSFNVLLIVPDGCGDEQNTFPPVFLLDTSKVFLSGTAAIALGCRLTI